jgi:hypothetical protein
MILVTVGKAGNSGGQGMLSFVAYPLSSIFYEPEQCFAALCARKGAALFSSQNEAYSRRRSVGGPTCLPVTLTILPNLSPVLLGHYINDVAIHRTSPTSEWIGYQIEAESHHRE